MLEVEIHLAALLGVIGLFGTNAYLLLLLRKLATQRHQIEGTFTGAATRRLRALQLGVTLDTILLATLLELSGGVTNPFCAFPIIHGSACLPAPSPLVAAGGVPCPRARRCARTCPAHLQRAPPRVGDRGRGLL